MKKIINLCIIIIFTSGCATMKDSILAGASIGALGGNAIGLNNGSRDNEGRKNAILVGALLGAGISYLSHNSKKKKEILNQQNNKDQKVAPLLTRPKVKRVWVEDKISGKRFIKGHWEFIIEEQSVWSRK